MFKKATKTERPSSQEKHTVHIGARVTPEEKKWITNQAMKCGKEREDFLNKYSNIILWIGDLKKLEKRVTSIIEKFFSENPIP